jgi:hypothetical protein
VLERVPLHPLFIVADLVLLFTSGDVTSVEVSTMLETGGLLLLGTAAVIALLIPVLGLKRAAIAAGVILILTIPLPTVLGTPATMDAQSRLAMLIGIPAAIAAVILALRLLPREARAATLALNVVTLALLAQAAREPLVETFAVFGHRPSTEHLFPDLPVAQAPKDGGPDVWNIVMDRYAGPETLRRVYGFDDEPFLRELEKRGFAVARAAAANYQRTAPSLASSLNLDYLTPLEAPSGILGYDELPLYRALHGDRASRFFAAEGYAVIHAGPWWEPTRHDDRETASLNYADKPELVRVMLERSLLGYLAVTSGMEFGNGLLTQCHRTRIQFDRLEAAAASPQRKFVFAHLLLPHPPYVLDAGGHCKDAAAAERLTRVENYVGQVRYANDRLLKLLDRILAGPRPAVIVLQADEGPWPAAFAGDEFDVGMDTTDAAWSDLKPDQIREKMMILYALRFPGDRPLRLADHATPVNTYRLILNRYFGTNYELLPDRSYLFKDRRNLYDFIDVTRFLQ